MATLAPLTRFKAFSAAGLPLVGGKLYSYQSGTTTPLATYTDQTGVTPNANPVILDANGEASVWLGPYAYKFVLTDSLDVVLQTTDKIYSPNSSLGAANIGADDGASGSIFTTVQGFISKVLSSVGASLIGFIQAGVGAVITTVQSELRRKVYPEQYGCTGLGIDDDTAGMQACFNANPNREIECNGTYLCQRLQILNNVSITGSGTFIHKANDAGVRRGLFESKSDYKLSISGTLTIDGNHANQTAAVGSYNLIWNSIGSLYIGPGVTVKDAKGHLIRCGNIDDFNAAYYAHDVWIDGVNASNPLSNSGDCIRIERTRGATVESCTVYGGYSSIRTQLYCKDLVIRNNESSYAHSDVGITASLSERIEIYGNNSHHHANHGVEVDGVVDCVVRDNKLHHNTKSGILAAEFGASFYANSATYWGPVSADYGGADYASQVYTSPLISNIRTFFENNDSFENGHPDRLVGCESDTYRGNCVSNTALTGGYTYQLSIEGGTLAKTGARVFDNVFEPYSGNTAAVGMNTYQFTATFGNNTVIGNYPLSAFAAVGQLDLNQANKFLTDDTKRSVNLTDIADASSKTKAAVTHTTTGNTTYAFTGVYGSGQGEKLVRFIARVSSGTQTAYISANLYDSAGVFVATIAAEQTFTLTTSYQEFVVRVGNSASVGNQIRPQIRIPVAGVTLFIQEMNVFVNQA